MDLRRELIDRALVVTPPVHRCTVEVPRSVTHHPVIGEGSVRRTFETMGDALGPLPGGARSYLEDRATPQAAFTRRSIEIASRVKNQVADGIGSVCSAFEAVKDSFFPFARGPGSQLVNGAKVVCPVVVGGAIEIARRVESQTTVGGTRVRLTLKRIDGLEIPLPTRCGRELEGRALSIRATRRSRPIEVPATKKHSASRAGRPIRSASEGVDDLQRPVAALVRVKLVYDTKPVRSAGRSHSVEIAALVNG